MYIAILTFIISTFLYFFYFKHQPLVIYLLFTFITQLLLNLYNTHQSFLNTLLQTILPWTLIFCTTIILLQIYPGFKNAFSDVIGYYIISKQLNNLLIQTFDLKDPIIQKVYNNPSLLINQFTPLNFDQSWQQLSHLIKDNSTREPILKLIILKDTIGEFLWYLYTGLIVIAISNANI